MKRVGVYSGALRSGAPSLAVMSMVACLWMIFPIAGGGLSAKEPSCGYSLVTQPGNDLYPYKVEQNGGFIAYVTIQDSAGAKVISIGGAWFKYRPDKKSISYAEKKLADKPATLEAAVKVAFHVWSKEHCK